MKLLTQCRSVNEVLSDYLDGKLNFWSTMLLRGHLLMCSKCRAYLIQFRRVRDLLDDPQQQSVALPDDFDSVMGRAVQRAQGDWKSHTK